MAGSPAGQDITTGLTFVRSHLGSALANNVQRTWNNSTDKPVDAMCFPGRIQARGIAHDDITEGDKWVLRAEMCWFYYNMDSNSLGEGYASRVNQ
ncbi:hypothetical protein Tco_0040163 [Tanacetum coccineum]